MPALELDSTEARVLGVLVEKEYTTPDQYPLSLKALTAGCNQRSNRAPAMDLTESEVTATIERLRRKSLVGASHAAGSRIERYRHSAAEVWSLTRPELAVLAELLLRGAQMPGELRGRADRMSPIADLPTLNGLLETLRGKGFVQRLEPLPGSRAPQWDQIVAGTADSAAVPPSSAQTGLPRTEPHSASALPEPSRPAPEAPAGGLEARVRALEEEVARLRNLLEDLSANR
jgi:uncharacterized protein YceH (UPF0502 family)